MPLCPALPTQSPQDHFSLLSPPPPPWSKFPPSLLDGPPPNDPSSFTPSTHPHRSCMLQPAWLQMSKPDVLAPSWTHFSSRMWLRESRSENFRAVLGLTRHLLYLPGLNTSPTCRLHSSHSDLHPVSECAWGSVHTVSSSWNLLPVLLCPHTSKQTSFPQVGPIHASTTCSAAQDPVPDLMHCCRHLEMLSNFGTRATAFSFCTGLYKSQGQACPLGSLHWPPRIVQTPLPDSSWCPAPTPSCHLSPSTFSQ